jgi:hypothetical protein
MTALQRLELRLAKEIRDRGNYRAVRREAAVAKMPRLLESVTLDNKYRLSSEGEYLLIPV